MALEGEQVVFDPKFHGSPPPSIAWYHNGCMVVSDYSIKLSESGKLTILCAEPCHNGKYRFTVSNSAGSVQGQVTLAVCSENGENPLLETVKSCPVEISKFGVHVAELHASNNQGFRKQYHVRPPLICDTHTMCTHTLESKFTTRSYQSIMICIISHYTPVICPSLFVFLSKHACLCASSTMSLTLYSGVGHFSVHGTVYHRAGNFRCKNIFMVCVNHKNKMYFT